MNDVDLKSEVESFWTNSPCGTEHSGSPAGSGAFFEETESRRWEVHRDWDRPFLKEAIRFQEHSNKDILEIGCGIGVDSLQFGRAGNRVTGIDLNKPSVELTRARFAHEGLEGRFLHGDAEALPFDDASFDLVYSFGVLHHSPDTQRTIDEVWRVLRPGGSTIIMLYHKLSAMVWARVLFHHGILERGLAKYPSMSGLLSAYTEFGSQVDGRVNPLTKAYTRNEVRRMFGAFSDVELEVHYLTPWHFGALAPLVDVLPISVKRRLSGWVGWNLIVRASKRRG